VILKKQVKIHAIQVGVPAGRIKASEEQTSGSGPSTQGKKKRETLASTDSCVVPHRSTNDSALWLTAQIRRDAVLSESYGQR